jgi:hypothetical protein
MLDIDRETLVGLGVAADTIVAVGAEDNVNLAARIAGHDWYYRHDRNPVVRELGERAYQKILEEMKKVPLPVALALWGEYAPPTSTFPLG